MIASTDFDRLNFRAPVLKDKRKPMTNIFGIDSEAYTNGVPFIICTSEADVFDPLSLPDAFFPKYNDAHFMVYNLKYDSGAILHHLGQIHLSILWADNDLSIPPFRYRYIPHKLLRISKGKKSVSFWDISQFYHMPLDTAAQIYLNDKKIEVPTKKFTPQYFARFRKSIIKYCIHDATLTKQLGIYLIEKLRSFNITTTSLYSCASISFKYFCDHSKVVTAYRWWKENQHDVLKFAVDSYEGGKFEVTARGTFPHAYEYDLTSAYPYEIANLVDISKARHVFSPVYHKDAVYGFLRVTINNPDSAHLPCGMMKNNVRIYPNGTYYLTITKQEYEYLCSINIDTTIHSAVWLFVDRKRYPYRNVIKTLFDIKAQYKGKDRMIYSVSKIIMNSMYGKFCQCLLDKDSNYQAGPGWNPIYASVITANTRIKVATIQNLLKTRCLAVHTDSVITTTPIPKSYITGQLGAFEYVTEGPTTLIACGMYQINDQCAFKGFRPAKGHTWQSILAKHKSKSVIPYKYIHVESWIESMAKNHSKEHINVFAPDLKNIDLNCDTKRNWPSTATGKTLLTTSEESLPKLIVEKNIPCFW